MTGEEIRLARLALGMSITEFGAAIGFQGNDTTISRKIRRIESDQETLNPSKVDAVRSMLKDHSAVIDRRR